MKGVTTSMKVPLFVDSVTGYLGATGMEETEVVDQHLCSEEEGKVVGIHGLRSHADARRC